MQQLTDLKAILHSKRANIYYLDKFHDAQNHQTYQNSHKLGIAKLHPCQLRYWQHWVHN
jgi:hypothetical protein